VGTDVVGTDVGASTEELTNEIPERFSTRGEVLITPVSDMCDEYTLVTWSRLAAGGDAPTDGVSRLGACVANTPANPVLPLEGAGHAARAPTTHSHPPCEAETEAEGTTSAQGARHEAKPWLRSTLHPARS